MDFLLCVAGGAVSGLAFVYENLYFLLFFAPSLYFYSLRNYKNPFLKGFLFGTVFYMFNSVFLSSLDIAHLTDSLFLRKLLPFIAYLIVCLAEGVFSGLFAAIYAKIKKVTGKNYQPLIFSSLYIIYEYLTGLSFSSLGFPFGRISVPFAKVPHLIQTASLFGMLFISFIIIYLSSSLAMCFIEKKGKFLVYPLVLTVLNTTFSFYLYRLPEKGEEITVKCVQNGYGGFEKWSTPPVTIIKNSLSEFNGADIILFAESAIPLYLNRTGYMEKLSSAANENGVTVITGAMHIAEDGKKYTSLYHFPYKEGEIYHKRHPVPFGEYYPILDIFSEDLRENSLSKGSSPSLLSDYKIGPIICFDSMFPSFSREDVKEGARLLCVSTNDSWFLRGNSSLLHLYHSVYRAIENGRYVARSACTGISAIIDSKGNILKKVPFNKTGAVTDTVLLTDELTPYTIWGDAPILIYAISVIVFALLREKRRNKNV